MFRIPINELSRKPELKTFLLTPEDLEAYQALSFVARTIYYKLRMRGRNHNAAMGEALAWDNKFPHTIREFGHLLGRIR